MDNLCREIELPVVPNYLKDIFENLENSSRHQVMMMGRRNGKSLLTKALIEARMNSPYVDPIFIKSIDDTLSKQLYDTINSGNIAVVSEGSVVNPHNPTLEYMDMLKARELMMPRESEYLNYWSFDDVEMDTRTIQGENRVRRKTVMPNGKVVYR